eukprot:759187-Hanusia_phi.AAC.6
MDRTGVDPSCGNPQPRIGAWNLGLSLVPSARSGQQTVSPPALSPSPAVHVAVTVNPACMRPSRSELDPRLRDRWHSRLPHVIVPPAHSGAVLEDAAGVRLSHRHVDPVVEHRHLDLPVVVAPPAHDGSVRRHIAFGHVGVEARMSLQPLGRPVGSRPTLAPA